MEIREAVEGDAQAMSDVLQELVAAGKRRNAATAGYACSHYVKHPNRLHCFVALDERGRIIGFQSLKRADAGNSYGTPVGWGIIGTHVRPSVARQGVGSRLFAATLAGAERAKIPAIEAYIGEANRAAIEYYDAMGFRTYRRATDVVCKVLELPGSSV